MHYVKVVTTIAEKSGDETYNYLYDYMVSLSTAKANKSTLQLKLPQPYRPQSFSILSELLEFLSEDHYLVAK